jgi:hypothetical protein
VTVAHRAVSTLVCIRYRDGDLGPYDEVALQLAVRGPNGSIGLYTLELPVTGRFTLEAGRAIWGLPKWLATTSMTASDRRTTVELADGDDIVLRAEFDAGPLPLPVPVILPLPVWAIRPDGPEAGAVLRGGMRIRLEGVRFRPGGATVDLGRHRMADTARRLGAGGRPLCTVSAPRMSGELGEWTTWEPSR